MIFFAGETPLDPGRLLGDFFFTGRDLLVALGPPTAGPFCSDTLPE